VYKKQTLGARAFRFVTRVSAGVADFPFLAAPAKRARFAKHARFASPPRPDHPANGRENGASRARRAKDARSARKTPERKY